MKLIIKIKSYVSLCIKKTIRGFVDFYMLRQRRNYNRYDLYKKLDNGLKLSALEKNK